MIGRILFFLSKKLLKYNDNNDFDHEIFFEGILVL